MINSLQRLFVILLVMAGMMISAQVNYFVSETTGNDSNDGLTWQTAFKTIDKPVSLKENTAGTYNIYVAKGTYNMQAHTLGAGVQMNVYGGFPVPNASTPPTATCTASVSDYTTNMSSSVNGSNWRLVGSGGGLLLNGFTYTITNTGGLFNGSFITVDGNDNDNAADAKNKIALTCSSMVP